MMIEDAIEHCEEKAKELRAQAALMDETDDERADCLECAAEHEQLAEWLTDYQRLLAEEEQRQFAEELHDLYLAFKTRRENKEKDKWEI